MSTNLQTIPPRSLGLRNGFNLGAQRPPNGSHIDKGDAFECTHAAFNLGWKFYARKKVPRPRTDRMEIRVGVQISDKEFSQKISISSVLVFKKKISWRKYETFAKMMFSFVKVFVFAKGQKKGFRPNPNGEGRIACSSSKTGANYSCIHPQQMRIFGKVGEFMFRQGAVLAA
jgi:hypothetical protein